MSDDLRNDDSADHEAWEALRATPVSEVLASDILHLLQLAAVHLAAEPANLEPAQLLIDVVGAIVAAGGDRLGEHLPLYREALSEVQQVYVRAASA